MLDLRSVLYTFFVGWRSIISLTKVYFLLQRIKFYLAGQYQRNAMLNFIRIMMVQPLDGALPTIKKVQLTAVKLAWIMLNVPSQVKRNVTFGFIARLEDGCHSPDIYQHKHQECLGLAFSWRWGRLGFGFLVDLLWRQWRWGRRGFAFWVSALRKDWREKDKDGKKWDKGGIKMGL